MLPSLKDIIKNYDLAPQKKWGQNFLTDPNILSRIVDCAGDLRGHHVVEVGPGPGGLTRYILDKAPLSLDVIEMDPRCIRVMEEVYQKAHPNTLRVHHGDALTFNLKDLTPSPRKVIANLPYNVSVPLLLQWLEHMENFSSLTLMFQKEVAERLVARPRTGAYGRLSVMTQYVAHATLNFDLPPGAFFPAPKVTSTVVTLTAKSKTSLLSWKALERVTAAAFNQRRKMLRASLKTLTPDPISLLDAAGINPTRRAEELSLEEFCTLASIWENRT